MEETNKNKFMAIIFFAFIIFLIIGGYIFTRKIKMKSQNKESSKTVEKETIKINENEDYIYFENEETINDEPDITYKDVIINFKNAQVINDTLKNENLNLKKSVTYLKDQTLDETKELMFPEVKIYQAKARDYQIYKTYKYASLVINNYNFDCYDGVLMTGVESYIISLDEGKILNINDIYDIFKIDEEIIKDIINSYLVAHQTIVNEIEVINVNETLNNLFDENHYAFYIDNNELYLSFIVKSNLIDYNENIKVS